jgi:hypothetical protein
MRDQTLFKIIGRADIQRPVRTLQYVHEVIHEPNCISASYLSVAILVLIRVDPTVLRDQ